MKSLNEVSDMSKYFEIEIYYCVFIENVTKYDEFLAYSYLLVKYLLLFVVFRNAFGL